mmetsp:Transcript_14966/g.45310  ORF Transcript_14966/g.45310 Transcript_14966/m.45310 type:complete len:276 (+) Transcript_14966:1025-1852(+)
MAPAPESREARLEGHAQERVLFSRGGGRRPRDDARHGFDQNAPPCYVVVVVAFLTKVRCGGVRGHQDFPRPAPHRERRRRADGAEAPRGGLNKKRSLLSESQRCGGPEEAHRGSRGVVVVVGALFLEERRKGAEAAAGRREKSHVVRAQGRAHLALRVVHCQRQRAQDHPPDVVVVVVVAIGRVRAQLAPGDAQGIKRGFGVQKVAAVETVSQAVGEARGELASQRDVGRYQHVDGGVAKGLCGVLVVFVVLAARKSEPTLRHEDLEEMAVRGLR